MSKDAVAKRSFQKRRTKLVYTGKITKSKKASKRFVKKKLSQSEVQNWVMYVMSGLTGRDY